MKACCGTSLLLIDEFGGGTEPQIGGAIAEAVLKRFNQKKTFGIITTHYQNLKHFAEDHEGVVNGAMLYDRQHMQALFQLQIGNPGSSFAVEIARKIGIPEEVIADASELVGKEYINADKYLQDIVRDKRYWENKRQNIHLREKEMEKTIARYETEIAELQRSRKEILRKAKEDAEQLLRESNAKIENTIKTIREAQAEKDKLEENDIRIPLDENSNDVTAFLAKQAVKATSKLKIRAIITDSYSGRTARNLAAFRGKYPVLAICYKEKTMRHLALSYGVEAIYMPELANGQEYYFAALRRLLKEGRLQPTDMVGYLSSGKEGTQTSFLEINVVEDALKHAEDTVLPNNNRYL